MAESKSPIICVTCKTPLPDGITVDDAPRYFCQTDLLPTRDGEGNWMVEAENILRFIKVVSTITWTGSKEADIEAREYNTILELIAELADEAGRRLTLAQEAMEVVHQRNKAHAGAMSNEGRD
jgi:hypothetical protein